MVSLLNTLPPSALWLLGILTPLAQILAAVHVVRTGRPYYWLWLILVFPGVGALIYFIAEVLPYAGRPRFANPLPSLLDVLVPGRELARLETTLELSPTVAARQALARYHWRKGDFAKAVALLEACLSGVYKDDPGIRMELAQLHFDAGHLDQAHALLAGLVATDAAHEPRKRDLLRARVAVERGDAAEARALYEALRASGPIPEEARVRLARLLDAAGEAEAAQALYAEVVRRMRIANNRDRRLHKPWLLAAREGLKQSAS